MAEEKKFLDASGLTNILTKNKELTDKINNRLFCGFGELSDSELVAIIQAADNGEIDLYEDLGWRVGDERVITATNNWADLTFALMDLGKNHSYELVDSVLDKEGNVRTKPSFIVGLKYVVQKDNQWRIGNTMKSTWNTVDFRSAGNTYYGKIPSSIKPIFKYIYAKVFNDGSSADAPSNTVSGWFFPPSIIEIYGFQHSDPTSYAAQQSYNMVDVKYMKQLEFFKSANNRYMTPSPYQSGYCSADSFVTKIYTRSYCPDNGPGWYSNELENTLGHYLPAAKLTTASTNKGNIAIIGAI